MFLNWSVVSVVHEVGQVLQSFSLVLLFVRFCCRLLQSPKSFASTFTKARRACLSPSPMGSLHRLLHQFKCKVTSRGGMARALPKGLVNWYCERPERNESTKLNCAVRKKRQERQRNTNKLRALQHSDLTIREHFASPLASTSRSQSSWNKSTKRDHWIGS